MVCIAEPPNAEPEVTRWIHRQVMTLVNLTPWPPLSPPPLLALAVVAKLAGHSRLEAVADWARLRAAELARLFGLTRSTMPHPSTWSRLLGQAVDPVAFEQALTTFFQTPPPDAPPRGSIILVVDGKTLRGTIPAGQTRGTHLVAAYLPEQGVVLAQLHVDTKENEIVVVPTLLAQLDLQGTVVVGDAMQTQRTLSVQVVEGGGDYLWFVKENQPSLLADIEELFLPPPMTPGMALRHTTSRSRASWTKGMDAWKSGCSPRASYSWATVTGRMWPTCSSSNARAGSTEGWRSTRCAMG